MLYDSTGWNLSSSGSCRDAGPGALLPSAKQEDLRPDLRPDLRTDWRPDLRTDWRPDWRPDLRTDWRTDWRSNESSACDEAHPYIAPGFERSHKAFLYPFSSCALSWTPTGGPNSAIECKSEVGAVTTECHKHRGDAYQCRQFVTGVESIQSAEEHNACVLSLNPSVGVARFNCEWAR